MLTPDHGSITVFGQASRRLGPEQFRQVGYLSENQELPLWMTVRQLLDYCRPMYPTWDVALAARLLKEMDLPPDRTLRALSRGMRVKAALLSSLAYRPRLVILDEPFSGLDPLVRDEFVRGLLELTEQEGWTVFVSSHDIEEVERLADRVAVIDRGRLQLAESVDELQQRFRSVEVALPDPATVPAGLPAAWLSVEASGRVVRFTDSAFEQARLAATVAQHFPQAKQHSATPLPLREIFVALARTYRLKQSTGEGGP
jgi:ABC-2 type transport system ATP-binding protein